jgi:excisionase family DNA binding protein
VEPRSTSPASPPVLSDNDDFPLYDAEQAAELLRMSKWWVLKEVREGRMDYVEQGNRYLFKPRHVRDAINRREVDRTTRGHKNHAV